MERINNIKRKLSLVNDKPKLYKAVNGKIVEFSKEDYDRFDGLSLEEKIKALVQMGGDDNQMFKPR
jgi:hypothetical protein